MEDYHGAVQRKAGELLDLFSSCLIRRPGTNRKISRKWISVEFGELSSRGEDCVELPFTIATLRKGRKELWKLSLYRGHIRAVGTLVPLCRSKTCTW
jgi:hypothetical protein